MRIGLVGWPGSGMSTLFKALGGKPQPGHKGGTRADSWPLVSLDVPDPRLEWLRELWKPKKYTPARIEFVDFPGIPDSREKGRGELMHALRDTDGLCLVVRDFQDPSYPYERPEPDPEGDLASLKTELLFGDYAAVEARIERLRERVKKPSKTREKEEKELRLLERCLPALEEGIPLREVKMSDSERALLAGFRFASEKPMIEILNVSEDRLGGDLPGNACCALLEAEIGELSLEERKEFLKDYGIEEPFRDRLVRMGYDTLGLASFFTMGEDEVRAWTIRAGDDAVTAAGKVHSDLARGFIRAEVISWEDLHAAGSVRDAKAKGLFRVEGRDYRVKDGDILNIRFSV